MKKPATGFTCECGTFHEFGVYAAAHYDIELIHTCPKCGKEHTIINMQAFSRKAKRAKSGAKRFLTQGDPS